MQIDAPKDAAAVDTCALAPADVVQRLGLLPQGESGSSSFGEENDDSCTWRSEDHFVSSALSVFFDRTIQDYYSNQGEYVDFEKLTIAGHPAVRANTTDPHKGGTCTFFLASKADQVVQATAQVDNRPVDPCELAQKTLDSAVPTWPAAQ